MLFESSPVIQVHFMNGVSDITFLRLLSTQDKHMCCIVRAAKKKKEREREGNKEGREEGRKYKRKCYILLAVRMDIVVF